MTEAGANEGPTCPSCGAPRLLRAWDCGACGAVFDDADAAGSPSGSDASPTSSPTRSRTAVPAGTARRSSSARRRPAATGSADTLNALRHWVADNITVAVILSFVVYVVVVWLFGMLIIGATDSPGAIKSAYRDLTGRPLPAGFGPTFAAHFVSRRLVVLDRPDQVVLVAYKDEDGSTDRELVVFAENALDLFEVPWTRLETRTAELAEETVEVPIFELWGEGGPHLYLLPTATRDGDRAIEAVVGAPDAVRDVVERMVETR